MREHGRQPTALEIARQAGVGLRTRFRHVGQMESLRAAVSQRMLEQVRGHTRLALEGTRDESVAALVRQRMRLFEEIARFERLATAAGGATAGQQPARAAFLALLRDQIVRVLEPADRGSLETLDAIPSFEHWDRLAHVQGLGRTRVARTLEAEVRAPLPGLRGERRLWPFQPEIQRGLHITEGYRASKDRLFRLSAPRTSLPRPWLWPSRARCWTCAEPCATRTCPIRSAQTLRGGLASAIRT